MTPRDLTQLLVPHLVQLITAWLGRGRPAFEEETGRVPAVSKPIAMPQRQPGYRNPWRVSLAIGVLVAVVPTLAYLGHRQRFHKKR